MVLFYEMFTAFFSKECSSKTQMRCLYACVSVIMKVLPSVLGPSLQERHRCPGVCPEEDNEAVKNLEQKSDEEGQRELGVFSLEEAQR